MRSNTKPTALVAMMATLLVMGALLLGTYRSLRSSRTTTTGRVAGSESITLLSSGQRLQGEKSIAHAEWSVDPTFLTHHNTLKIGYNLHGLCLLRGKASEIAITTQFPVTTSTVSLASYGKNCFDGQQDIAIPLIHFSSLPESVSAPVRLGVSFWYPTVYSIDIAQISFITNDTAVLGIATAPTGTKTFPAITPIRPEPYAKTNTSEE